MFSRSLRTALLGALCCVHLPLAGQQRAALDDAERTAMQQAMGLDPLEVLRRIGGAASWEDATAPRALLQELAAPDRCLLVRAALWSEDPDVAFGAVCEANLWWLDFEEIRRAVDVGLPRCLGPDSPLGFADFTYFFVASDVSRILDQEHPMPRDIYNVVSQVHRKMRPEHIPQVCVLTRSPDVLLRQDAFDSLRIPALLTDRHRELVGRTLLLWPGRYRGGADIGEVEVPVPEREVRLPAATGGYHPVLVAVLRRLFLEECDEELAKWRPWARRWAAQSKPSPVDLAVLLELARSEHEIGQQIAASGLAQLDAAAATVGLREIAAAGGEGDAPMLALAALMERGDEDAAREVRARAAREPAWLAAWLGTRPEDALAAWSEQAFGEDVDRGIRALRRLEDAQDRAVYLPIELPTELEGRIAALAEKARLDEHRLALLLARFPGARTRALGARLRDELSAELLPALVPSFGEDLADAAAVLEVDDAPAFKGRLRQFLDHDRGEVRNAAHTLLLRLGDRGTAVSNWQWLQGRDDPDLHLLARSGNEEVRAALIEQMRAMEPPDPDERQLAPLTALAAMHGMDERLARSWAEDLADAGEDELRAIWSDLVRKVAGGRPSEALALYLAQRPLDRGNFRHLGRAPHPAVREYLERWQTERHHGLYAHALAELALLGDEDAKRQLERAFELGQYAWFDNLPVYALTLGEGLARLRPCIDALESNCCMYAVIASRIEDLLDVDAFFPSETAVLSRPRAVELFWESYRDRLAFSRIAGRFIVGPR